LAGHRGDDIDGYAARPLGAGPYPAIAVIHHAPGLDEETEDVVRRLAARGYAAIAPHLYSRESVGTDSGTAAKIVRGAGGLADDQMLGDLDGTVTWLRRQPYVSGKIGILGFCSGGRQAYICACRLELDAAVDCYGGSVVAAAEKLTPGRPVAPIDMTATLSCPLLGIFGGDDSHVPPDHIAAIEAAAAQYGKSFEYHVYDGAPHAFLGHYHASYRVVAANEAWEQIFAFLGRTLA
jgi:carboxymethylenebutenolidase